MDSTIDLQKNETSVQLVAEEIDVAKIANDLKQFIADNVVINDNDVIAESKSDDARDASKEDDSKQLLDDCRKERPKRKSRPPSQAFLKQMALNSPDVEDENCFDIFYNSNSQDEAKEVQTTEVATADETPAASVVDEVPVVASVEDRCDGNTESVIVKKPHMKNIFSLELLDEMKKSLSEPTHRNVSSEHVECKLYQFDHKEPPWMAELSKRKLNKSNPSPTVDLNQLADQMQEEVDDLQKLEVELERLTENLGLTDENVDVLQPKPAEDDFASKHEEDVSLRQPVVEAAQEPSAETDTKFADFARSLLGSAWDLREDVVDFPKNEKKSPIISESNECIRKSREIIMHNFSVTQTNEAKKVACDIDFSSQTPTKKCELNELKLSPTTVTFVPKFSPHVNDNDSQRKIDDQTFDIPSQSSSSGKMTRTVIFTSKKSGEEPKTIVKKEETTYQMDDNNNIKMQTHEETKSMPEGEEQPIVKKPTFLDSNLNKVLKVEETSRKTSSIALESISQGRTYTREHRLSVKEAASGFDQKEETSAMEQPRWLKVLKSRKPAAVPKTEQPITWLEEMKLRRERCQERAPKTDE